MAKGNNMNEETKNLWWGYKHTNGSLQVKRYFDKRDIDEAKESDFVDVAAGPFYAGDREEALTVLQTYLGGC